MTMYRKFAILAAAALTSAAVSTSAFAFNDEAGCLDEVRDAEQLLVKSNVSTENFATIGVELDQIRGLCGTDLNDAKTRLATAIKSISAAAGN